MVAMVELQLNNSQDHPVPTWLLMVFGVCTVLLVSTHLLALMISTCISPYVDAIACIEDPTPEEIKVRPLIVSIRT